MCQGDGSTDTHARFNLSPVPSIEDEEERYAAHETTPTMETSDQEPEDDPDEQEENPTDTTALTTTVNLFDNDHIVTAPPIHQDNQQGIDLKKEYFSEDFCLSVTNVAYVVRKHYENFETIDWLKDLMRSRIRHRNLRAQGQKSWQNRFHFLFDTWSGWICVLLVGISAGSIHLLYQNK